MNDLILHFRTWGDSPRSVIRAGALATFEPRTGRIAFDARIDLRATIDEQLELGRTIEQHAVDRILSQSRRLPTILRPEPERPVTPCPTLALFALLLDKACQAPIGRVYADGRLQINLLDDLLQQLGRTLPWCPAQEMDIATLLHANDIPAAAEQLDPLARIGQQITQISSIFRAVDYGDDPIHELAPAFP